MNGLEASEDKDLFGGDWLSSHLLRHFFEKTAGIFVSLRHTFWFSHNFVFVPTIKPTNNTLSYPKHNSRINKMTRKASHPSSSPQSEGGNPCLRGPNGRRYILPREIGSPITTPRQLPSPFLRRLNKEEVCDILQAAIDLVNEDLMDGSLQ